MFIMILIVLYWILKINYRINASLIDIKEYKKLKSGLNYKKIVEKIEKQSSR